MKFKATLSNRTRTLEVMSCQHAAILGFRPPRAYGYTIVINPPIADVIDGMDVEGIGYVAVPTHTTYQHYMGWYKHKASAVQRAKDVGGTLVQSVR